MIALSPNPLIDVLIVTRNNDQQFEGCVESLLTSTVVPFRLNVYFNESGNGPEPSPSVDFMIDLARQGKGRYGIQWGTSIRNEGFILPNNRLAAMCDASYLFLLNDDTILRPGWDIALLNAFNAIPNVGIAGFSGGLLNENGLGCGAIGWHEDSHGGVTDNIDYVEGWSLMASWESIHSQLSFDGRLPHCTLFDKHLDFAYAEDSELCLRVKEKGYRVVAVQNKNVDGEEFITHLGGQTTAKVVQEPDNPVKERLRASFEANHAYLRQRHADYLANHRILARQERERIEDLYGAV